MEIFKGRKKATLLKSSLEKARDQFTDFIGSDFIRDLSGKWLYPTGIFCVLIFFGLWFYFTYSAITTYSPFLTMDTDGLNCQTILTTNTGEYYLTYDGYWGGSDGFNYYNVAYMLTQTNSEIYPDAYANQVNNIYLLLKYKGKELMTQDLSGMIIFWTSFLLTINNGAQRFSMIAQPSIIFNRQHVSGSLTSLHGICQANSTSSFDPISSMFSLTFDYPSFSRSKQCTSTGLDPKWMGYDGKSDGDAFNILLDSRSILTAQAVNLRQISADDLIFVPSQSRNITVASGQVIGVKRGYSPKFPGMDLITCFWLKIPITGESTTACVVSVGDIYGFPAFNHRGKSDTEPSLCDCKKSDSELYDDPEYICNTFHLITGMLFWPSAITLKDAATKVVLLYTFIGASSAYATFSYTSMFRLAFYSSIWGSQLPNADVAVSKAIRQVCKNTNCTFLSFSVYDSDQTSWAVADTYYEVRNGACRDTVSSTKEAWSLAASSPFAPLTQDYSRCSYFWSDLVLQAAGAGIGNASVLFPIAVAIIVSVLGFLKKKNFIPDFYAKPEREEMMNALSLVLLRIRDGEMGHRSGILRQFVDELRQLAEEDEEWGIAGDGGGAVDERSEVDGEGVGRGDGRVTENSSAYERSLDGTERARFHRADKGFPSRGSDSMRASIVRTSPGRSSGTNGINEETVDEYHANAYSRAYRQALLQSIPTTKSPSLSLSHPHNLQSSAAL